MELIVFIDEEGKIQKELSAEERTFIVEALREKAANLSSFSGRIDSRRGAEALTLLESWVRRMRNLADRFEGKECERK